MCSVTGFSEHVSFGRTKQNHDPIVCANNVNGIQSITTIFQFDESRRRTQRIKYASHKSGILIKRNTNTNILQSLKVIYISFFPM